MAVRIWDIVDGDEQPPAQLVYNANAAANRAHQPAVRDYNMRSAEAANTITSSCIKSIQLEAQLRRIDHQPSPPFFNNNQRCGLQEPHLEDHSFHQFSKSPPQSIATEETLAYKQPWMAL